MRTFEKLHRQLATTLVGAILIGVGVVALSIRFPIPVHAQTGQPAGQRNILVTVSSAGTPVQPTSAHIIISSYMVEPVVGASVGLISLCTGIQTGTTPAAQCAATANGSYELGAQLAAATSTIPGAVYSFYPPAPGVDASTIWMDALVSGTSAIFTFYVHQ
jgi:hypothetical protein